MRLGRDLLANLTKYQMLVQADARDGAGRPEGCG